MSDKKPDKDAVEAGRDDCRNSAVLVCLKRYGSQYSKDDAIMLSAKRGFDIGHARAMRECEEKLAKAREALRIIFENETVYFRNKSTGAMEGRPCFPRKVAEEALNELTESGMFTKRNGDLSDKLSKALNAIEAATDSQSEPAAGALAIAFPCGPVGAGGKIIFSYDGKEIRCSGSGGRLDELASRSELECMARNLSIASRSLLMAERAEEALKEIGG